ncbi:low molecular weight phosphotyrosine protein phosphatase-like [Littorina saxatilis]|uniref:Low molecular weight phosphotyrosine protein phosphatase n=1 Tax=Littorina saxatilis TaxID=31220 RepID=A0AAN9B4X4_9CAEN
MAAPLAKKRSVLFVCLGNICRSTMAEAILLHLIKEKGETDKWVVDSAAVADYNIGLPPNSRAISTLKKNGITGYTHTARLLTPEDYNKFDIIFGMDKENMMDMEEMKPKGKCRAQLQMLGDWDPKKERIIVDPYFSNGTKAFDVVYDQCIRCLTALVNAPDG